MYFLQSDGTIDVKFQFKSYIFKFYFFSSVVLIFFFNTAKLRLYLKKIIKYN